MKKQILLLALLSLFFMIVSCSEGGNRFRMKGRLLHFNQGTFLVYSHSGGLDRIDTITIDGGRFVWEIPCEEKATMIMVLPNFSEQPVFIEPGGKAVLEADAMRLSEMEISGTKDNELMTAFRRQIVNTSPPETRQRAAEFIKNHPQSAVADYLLQRYFIDTDNPDYETAIGLIDYLMQTSKETASLEALKKTLQECKRIVQAASLPAFSINDINGTAVSSEALKQGVTVIYTWAAWSYESQNMQRRINTLHSDNGRRLNLVAISLDADRKECRKAAERESIKARQICDGEMLLSPFVKRLGLTTVMDNILLVDGKIVGRALSTDELISKAQQFLK